MRGTISTAKGTRVEVRVSRRGKRVARWVKTATAPATRFSLAAKPGVLTVTVTVAPPKVLRTFKVTLRK